MHSLCLSQAFCVCHTLSVSVTYNMCLSQTGFVCPRQVLYVTDRFCLSQTCFVCHRQFLSVTDRFCLSQTVCVPKSICVCNRLSLFVKEICWCHLQSMYTSKTLLDIDFYLFIHDFMRILPWDIDLSSILILRILALWTPAPQVHPNSKTIMKLRYRFKWCCNGKWAVGM